MPLMISAALLLLAGQLPQEPEPGWSEPVSLSENFPQSYLPDIAADRAGNLYVAWDVVYEARDDGWGEGIGFAMWDGESWSPGVDIFSGQITHLPSIAADSQGRLHLMGVTYVGGGIIPQHSELRYSRAWAQQRPVDAQSWSTPVDLAPEYAVYWNDMVVDSRDWIHVVFAGWDPYVSPVIADGQCTGEGCSRVYYIRSIDGGDSWSTPVEISPAIPGPANGRVQIVADSHDNLYVVWSSESYRLGSSFAPSVNGFTYSIDGGASWSGPETQLFDTGDEVASDETSSYDYWVSIAVDSQQTIHLVAVGYDLRHLYRQGLNGAWMEDDVPRIALWQELGQNYGFRGIAVDSGDNLHFIFPTLQLEGSQVLPGLFHMTWNATEGWSSWGRATANARGRGCGLGNLVVTGGNQLDVAWFEFLEGGSSSPFAVPRGRIEIYFASLQTGMPSVPLSSLPPLPSPTATAPAAEPAVTPQAVASATPRVATGNPTDAGDSRSGLTLVSALVAGVGATMLVLAFVVGVVMVRRRR